MNVVIVKALKQMEGDKLTSLLGLRYKAYKG